MTSKEAFITLTKQGLQFFPLNYKGRLPDYDGRVWMHYDTVRCFNYTPE